MVEGKQMSAPYNYTQYYSGGTWYYSFEGHNSFHYHEKGMNLLRNGRIDPKGYGVDKQQFLILPKELL